MALLPPPIPCTEIPTIEGCLVDFLISLSPTSKSGFIEVINALLVRLNDELSTLTARIEAQTKALGNAISRNLNLKAACEAVEAVLNEIDAFLSNVPCPELFIIKVLFEAYKAALLAQIGDINIPGIQELLVELQALEASLVCQISNLTKVLEFISG